MDSQEKIYKMQKARERQNRIDQGFFDGRFRPKSIPNKKKETERKITRSKIPVHFCTYK
jgi:hypothetical protein